MSAIVANLIEEADIVVVSGGLDMVDRRCLLLAVVLGSGLMATRVLASDADAYNQAL